MVEQEGQTAGEEKRDDDLAKTAANRNRTAKARQLRGRAAVGLGAAKGARMREEGDDGAKGGEDRRPPYVWSGSGSVEQVLPGPPGVYTLYITRVEAVGSAAVGQLAETRCEVQEAVDRGTAEDRAAVARMRED